MRLLILATATIAAAGGYAFAHARTPAVPDEHANHADHSASGAVVLTAQQAAAIPASGATATQRIAASPRHGEWVAIKVGATDSVMAWVVYPERSQKAPVVIAIHENTGLNIWTRSVADQLAADGFIGLLGWPVLGLLVAPGMDRWSRPSGVLGACIWAWATPAAAIRARAARVVRIMVVLLQWGHLCD